MTSAQSIYRRLEAACHLAEMERWLEECGADLTDRDEAEIVQEIERIYYGGVGQFVRDQEAV